MIRELSFGELRMHLLHHMGGGTTQGALNQRIFGHIDIDKFRQVLGKVIELNAPLQYVIRKEQGRYGFFYGDKHFNVDDFLIINEKSNSPETWDKKLVFENESLLDSASQLWRISIDTYPSGYAFWDITLVMHHALMDAAGSEYLLGEIFNGLYANQSGEPLHRQNDMTSMETNALTKCEWDQFAQIQSSVADHVTGLKLMHHLCSAPLLLRRNCVQFFKLGKSETKRLSLFAADKDVSVNSLISALLLNAVSQHSPSRDQFALYSAISMRTFCPDVPDKGLGCYLNVMPTFHTVKPNNLEGICDLAKDHKVQTQKAFLEVGRWVPTTYNTKHVEQMIKGATESNQFKNDIGFTYAETDDTERNYRVLHKYVIARRNIGNVALILHGLKENGEIFFTLTHVEPIQSKEWAFAVKQTFMEELDSLCSA